MVIINTLKVEQTDRPSYITLIIYEGWSICSTNTQSTVLTGCMGSRKGLGPGGTGGGETPLGMGDIGVGHLGLGQGMPYGIRLPNMFIPGLPSRGGGEGAYGDGGRKCRGDQPRPPGPPGGPPDMVYVRALHLYLVRVCDTCHRIWNRKIVFLKCTVHIVLKTFQ